MSTNERHKANLARIRDNQRRSRARRREYVHELEQRLRLCELQGVEASAEVQGAARRVADENRRLRVLLNKHGISDDTIARYLHEGAVANTSHPASQISPTGRTESAVQSLQNVIAPRKPACLNANLVYSMPRNFDREGSVVSVATSNCSSPWEQSQLATPISQSQTPQPPNLSPTPMFMPAHQQRLHVYAENSAPRSQAGPTQPPLLSSEETYQHNYTVQPVLFDSQSMAYEMSLGYQGDAHLHFPHPPGGC